MNIIFLKMILLLLPVFSFSQIKGIVVDSITKIEVPYVNIWVEDTNNGTTSNEDGRFLMEDRDSFKTLVFSAIGYETKKINSNYTKDSIFLNPIITELDEIELKVKKETKEIRVGTFKRRKIRNFWSMSPSIVSKFFNYSTVYEKTPFIKGINVLTKSNIKNGKFLVHIYAVNESNEPGELLHDKNILVTARKGKKITKIDLSKLNIQFPKNGIYIGLNALKIDSNKYIYTADEWDTNKKITITAYHPNFAITPAEVKTKDKIMRNGKVADLPNIKLFNNKKNKFTTLAIELVLTN